MRVVGVIPARFASTRLPGKPLQDILGKPMIQHVYENAARSKTLAALIVATDDERIMPAVAGFGGKAVLTSRDHNTGTDRVAEVVRGLDAEIVVNIQGDEPFVRPGMIDEVVQPLLDDPSLPMCTSMHEITDPADFANPNVVKVVVDLAGNALYFSRSLIPYPRRSEGHRAFEHIGMYAYTREFLLAVRGAAADAAGEAGVPGAAARARARPQAAGGGDPPGLRPAQRGHARGPRTGARAGPDSAGSVSRPA